MTKRELKELLGYEYPKIDYYENRLFNRLSIFPKAIEVYGRCLENIYTRSGEWFLVEQLKPSLANKPFDNTSVSTHMESIIHHHDVLNIDWISVYKFVDTCLEDGYMKDLLNRNRERFLLQYDII
jgi:hypothetical protein